MSSFNRSNYQQVYAFARKMFYYFTSRDEDYETEACQIMQACENVLGQQSDFPPEAREILKDLL